MPAQRRPILWLHVVGLHYCTQRASDLVQCFGSYDNFEAFAVQIEFYFSSGWHQTEVCRELLF
jgi:hypothetical protein